MIVVLPYGADFMRTKTLSREVFATPIFARMILGLIEEDGIVVSLKKIGMKQTISPCNGVTDDDFGFTLVVRGWIEHDGIIVLFEKIFINQPITPFN